MQSEVESEEIDFCRVIPPPSNGQQRGLSTAGTIPGVFSSSARAELASVITALAKPGSLHIALDNLAVVNGLNDIIAGAQRSKRPWALRPDGDLWAIAERAIQQRGAHSLTFTWTKGHATWRHMLDGVTTYRDAIGNGFADAAADQGQAVTGKQPEQLILNEVAAQQSAYVSFICRMQRFAIVIINADKAERQRCDFKPKGKTADIEWLDIPNEPCARPAFEDGSKLEMHSLPRSLEGPLEEISIFWSVTRWAPQGNPTTWLELYALYRLWGGGSCRESQDPHSPNISFQQGLSTFIKESKQYIKIAGTSETKQAVQAYQGSELLMRRLGIFMRAPAIKACLCIDPAINMCIHTMLIDIRRTKGKNGTEVLKGSPLPFPKHEPWANTLNRYLKARAASGSPSIALKNREHRKASTITHKSEEGMAEI